jgi:hypothetical protein
MIDSQNPLHGANVADPLARGDRHSEQLHHNESTDHEEPSLVEVLGAYSEAGFNGDAFASKDGLILCGSCQSHLSPHYIGVHSIRRLEGKSDPSDNIGVVAIICPVCQSHATMVLKYGPEASPEEVAIWLGTKDRRKDWALASAHPPSEDRLHKGPPVYGTPTAKPEMPPPIEFE